MRPSPPYLGLIVAAIRESDADATTVKGGINEWAKKAELAYRSSLEGKESRNGVH